MEKPAIMGGPKAKTVPFGSGARFGEAELQQLREALDQQTLFYWSGNKVKTFTQKFAGMYGMPYCVAASSGTAAIHVALGAVGITEGDEVITSPITDMGSVIGILYQNAIPIFADLDPHTYNMTAATIEARITDKTKAILVVHLAGNAADMDPIMELAARHGIKVIEDCAQSYNCYYKGRLAGTIGDIGCFSLNDFKHISAGDGGMVIMRDEDLYYRAFRFADKNYNRFPNLPGTNRDIALLAPNYRMNELTGAVAIAQLDRLESICARRNQYGDALTRGISGLPGIYPPMVLPENKSSYWFYMLRIDENEAGVSREDFCAALQAEGVPCSAGYIPTCVYAYPLFKNLSAYPGTHSPFDSPHYNRKITYEDGLCPNAEKILTTAVRLSVNEHYTDQDLDEVIAAIRKISAYYLQKKG
ncbi:MAG: DegT/DnrJ/EryC1/StrS family aminotransferase [Ruminococcaceae bacterium]|jgi:dTDP-4-amino-4,6-dideoxygalactose transaminase|nr:DegT/DnrJ/EryC1/StrS family aminotransferase [Oscillospiraceae bacterium]